MYSRQIGEGAPASFGVSGKLWHGVLVMVDRETKSLWTQLDGRSIRGKLRGRRLEHLDSVYTTWGAWREEHPDSLVLRKDEEEIGQTESHYASYFEDPEELFFTDLKEHLGGIAPKDVVFGVLAGGGALAVSERLLERDGVVNVVVGDVPAALILDRTTRFATAVDRRHGGAVLLLGRGDSAGDDPAEPVVDRASGRPVDLDTLARLRVDRAFWYAWKRSHPDSRVLAN